VPSVAHRVGWPENQVCAIPLNLSADAVLAASARCELGQLALATLDIRPLRRRGAFPPGW